MPKRRCGAAGICRGAPRAAGNCMAGAKVTGERGDLRGGFAREAECVEVEQ
ncbi:MAG: hypothetical protein AB7I19_10310 [Planctomycetota bacterium]